MYGGNTKTIAIPIYKVLPYLVTRSQKCTFLCTFVTKRDITTWPLGEGSLTLAPIMYLNCFCDLTLFFTVSCIEDEVRLNDEVIQVCHDGQWGLVCYSSYYWNSYAAQVVCKEVGIPSICQLAI